MIFIRCQYNPKVYKNIIIKEFRNTLIKIREVAGEIQFLTCIASLIEKNHNWKDIMHED